MLSVGFIWIGLDESSDRLQRKVFVVAGYLARQSEWTEIERHWLRRLEQECNPVPMRYFSSSECAFLSGEFRRFRDATKYPKPKGRKAANAVRDDLEQILRASSAIGFVLGVNLKDYRAVRKSSRARKTLGSNPYEQTYLTMFIRVAGSCDDEMPSRVNTETIAFLCDEHDRSVNVKAVYDRLKDNNPTCAPWMGSLSYMDNEHSPALQAGDLLASRSKDFLVETIDNPRHETKEQIVARWKPILGRNVGVGCMDKSSLSLLVDANVLKKGKFSIYSTQQLTLFKGLT
jgi:hypothetical protein